MAACGVDAGCNCGAAVVSKSQRIADYDAANPRKSTRQVAAALGVDNSTVHRARQKSGVADATPEDGRPTIDNPPRGALWDDQNDKDDSYRTLR